jgi:hypothetical protein
MFQQRSNTAPILIVGARLEEAAEHLSVLDINEYYGPNRVRNCSSPDAVAHYLSDRPATVVRFYNGEEATAIRNLFDTMDATKMDATKILALNQKVAFPTTEKPIFGQDFTLQFSDEMAQDAFHYQLRNMIGPSAREISNAEKTDHSKCAPLKRCLTAVELDALDAHFGKIENVGELRMESINSHLVNCESCKSKVANLPNVHSAGVKMLTNRSVHDSNPPGFHTKTVRNLRHY